MASVAKDYLERAATRILEIGRHANKNVGKFFQLLRGEGPGSEGAQLAPDDEAALKTFRAAVAVDPARPPKVAVVGVTSGGKSRLLCTLFGDDNAFLTKASIDTTDKLFKTVLPNGLVIVDTPGVGGDRDVFENVTRAYLGLEQVEGDDDGEGPHRVDGVPICSVGDQQQCPVRELVPCEIHGKKAVQIVIPLAFQPVEQTVYRRMAWTETQTMLRENPISVRLEPCCRAIEGKPCPHLNVVESGTKAFKELQPDVVLVLAASPRGGFQRFEKQFVKQLKASAMGQRLLFVLNVWESKDPMDGILVLQKIQEQTGEDVTQVNALTGKGVRDLVRRIFMRLPTATATKFNSALVNDLRESREELAGAIIRKTAAQCAVTRTDATVKVGETDLPEQQKLVLVMLQRLSDLHRVPDSEWQKVGGDLERFLDETLSAERFAEMLRKSGVKVEVVDTITEPDFEEKKVRIPRTGFGGWLSRTWLGREVFSMRDYEIEVRKIEVQVTKEIRSYHLEPGRGGAEGARIALEIGIAAHHRMWAASQEKKKTIRTSDVSRHVSTMMEAVGLARLTELSQQGSEKKVADDLAAHLPDNWLSVG